MQMNVRLFSYEIEQIRQLGKEIKACKTPIDSKQMTKELKM